MKRQHILLSTLLLLTTTLFQAYESDYYEYGDDDVEVSEKDVVVVTAKNWDSVVKETKFALVEFYAPWCGHCKALKPEYARAASKLKAINPSVVVAKVDATVETELSERFNIEGYPTLKWFVEGSESVYSGGRDEESIVYWVQKKTGPVAVTVKTVEAMNKLLDENEVATIGFFEDLSGDMYDAFITAARDMEDSVFALTLFSDVAASIGFKQGTKFGVTLVRNFAWENRTIVPLIEDVTSENVQSFVLAEKLPLVIPFNENTSSRIFEGGIDRQILFLGPKNVLKQYEPLIREAGSNYRGLAVMVTSDTEEEHTDAILDYFDLEKKEDIQVVGFFLERGKKYELKITNELNVDMVKTFTKGVIEGTLRPKTKSDPVPVDNVDNNVVIVVGNTVDILVKDESKDVLLEIYAPWCGHCKQLAPIYAKLGKRFSGIDSVIIAKMDGTTNEHPDIEFEGFPTIQFFPACDVSDLDCEVVEYEGERSLQAMTKFIKKYAQIPYELPKKKAAEGALEQEETQEKGGVHEEL